MAEEHCIDARDVQVDDEKNVFPTDAKRIASYNWSKTSTSEQPRIIVPGWPLNFVPPTRPEFELSRDTSTSWFDNQNLIDMSPFSAMEPMFHSLSICAPHVDLSAFDVITDKFELMRLLRFCRSPGDRDAKYHGLNNQPFKFFIHAKGHARDGKPPTLVFSPARAQAEGEKYSAGFGRGFHDMLTDMDPAAPSDAENFQLIRKMDLDGISLLVRSNVGACDTGVTRTPTSHRRQANNMGALNAHLRSLLLEAAGQVEPKKETAPASPAKTVPPPSASRGHCRSADAAGQNEPQENASLPSPEKMTPLLQSSTSGQKVPSTGSELESMKNGELLSEDAKLVELKAASKSRGRNLNWKDFLWNQLLGGARGLMLGVYELKHRNGDVAIFRNPEKLGIEEIQARADKTGSSSLVYLANTLREVTQIAHHLIANSPGKDGGEGSCLGVVVKHFPGDKVLRLRLAVPEDGAIAP